MSANAPAVNAVCVIWNCSQIAHNARRGVLDLEDGMDRCRC